MNETNATEEQVAEQPGQEEAPPLADTEEAPVSIDDYDGLQATHIRTENYMKVSLIDVKPKPGAPMLAISGANGVGKSSFIDSIVAGFEGGRSMPDQPIRKGEDKATIEMRLVKLGDEEIALNIKRTITPSGPRLELTTNKNQRIPSPQAFLDGLYGDLTFDPIAFPKLKTSDQVERLLKIAKQDINLVAINESRALLDTARKTTEKELKEAKKRFDEEFAEIPDSKPEAVDMSANIAERAIRDAKAGAHREAEKQMEAAKERERLAASALEEAKANCDKIENQLKEALAKAEKAEEQFILMGKSTETAQSALDDNPMPSYADLDQQLLDAEKIQCEITRFEEKNRLRVDIAAKEKALGEVNTRITSIDTMKRTALAKAQLPVPGLAFDENGPTFNGVPLAQCSTSERIRVGTAVAMAANPKVRIIRIADGSLLDKKSKAEVAKLAKENGFQVLIEEVDETGTVGIVIEDGHVVAVN